MSDANKDLYIKCDCDASEHLVRLTYWPGGNLSDSELWIRIQPVAYGSVWKRLRTAVRYLFKRGPGDDFWAETIVSEDEVDKMETFLGECLLDMHNKRNKGERYIAGE